MLSSKYRVELLHYHFQEEIELMQIVSFEVVLGLKVKIPDNEGSIVLTGFIKLAIGPNYKAEFNKCFANN